MRIAICDDESICIEQVSAAVARYTAERADRHAELDAFSHPEDLLEAAEKIGGYDVYILDVVMPTTNGITLGAKLRDAGYNGWLSLEFEGMEDNIPALSGGLSYLRKVVEA